MALQIKKQQNIWEALGSFANDTGKNIGNILGDTGKSIGNTVNNVSSFVNQPRPQAPDVSPIGNIIRGANAIVPAITYVGKNYIAPVADNFNKSVNTWVNGPSALDKNEQSRRIKLVQTNPNDFINAYNMTDDNGQRKMREDLQKTATDYSMMGDNPTLQQASKDAQLRLQLLQSKKEDLAKYNLPEVTNKQTLGNTLGYIGKLGQGIGSGLLKGGAGALGSAASFVSSAVTGDANNDVTKGTKKYQEGISKWQKDVGANEVVDFIGNLPGGIASGLVDPASYMVRGVRNLPEGVAADIAAGSGDKYVRNEGIRLQKELQKRQFGEDVAKNGDLAMTLEGVARPAEAILNVATGGTASVWKQAVKQTYKQVAKSAGKAGLINIAAGVPISVAEQVARGQEVTPQSVATDAIVQGVLGTTLAGVPGVIKTKGAKRVAEIKAKQNLGENVIPDLTPEQTKSIIPQNADDNIRAKTEDAIGMKLSDKQAASLADNAPKPAEASIEPTSPIVTKTPALTPEVGKVPDQLTNISDNITKNNLSLDDVRKDMENGLKTKNLTHRDYAQRVNDNIISNYGSIDNFYKSVIDSKVKPIGNLVPKIDNNVSYDTAQRINYGLSHGKQVKGTDWNMTGTAPGDSHDMVGLINSKTGEYKQFDIPKGDYSKPTFENLKQQATDFATGKSTPQVTKTPVKLKEEVIPPAEVKPKVGLLNNAEPKLLSDGGGPTLTPGQAKVRFKSLNKRGQGFTVMNKLPSKTKPINLLSTAEETANVATKTTKAGNVLPIGARAGNMIPKQINKVKFKKSLLFGIPERVTEEMTKDPVGRRILKEFVVKPQNTAVSRGAVETSYRLAKAKDILDTAGIRGGSKLDKKFIQFVESGGAKSKKARAGLYKAVGGKENARPLIEADTKLRAFTDDLFNAQNEARARVGKELIPYRKNYLTSLKDDRFLGGTLDFTETGQAGSRFARATGNLNPFAKQRVASRTQFNTAKALDSYTRQAVGEIYSHEPVGRLNSLIDALKERNDVPQNVINWLEEQRNAVAGLKPAVDTAIDSTQLGNLSGKVINKATQQAGANLIGLNPASVLTQPAQLVQSGAVSGWGNTLKALAAPLKGKELTAESEFLRGRHANLDRIQPGLSRQLIGISLKPIEGAQKVVDRIVYQAAKYRAKQLGLSGKAALDFANEASQRTLGARGAGQVPHLYNSKYARPVLQFTLEMGNGLHQLAADELRRGRIGGIISFSIGAYGFNQAFNAITGRDQGVLVDPIQAGIDVTDDIKKGRYLEAAARFPGEIIANMPGGQAVAGITTATNPDLGNRLFGQAGAGRYGVGVPAVQATTAVVKGVTGQGPIADALAYLAPAGGVPIKRTVEGVKAFSEGQATGKGGQKLYDINQDPLNATRAALFGKQTTVEGKKYTQEMKTRTTLLNEASRGATADEQRTLEALTGSKRNPNTGAYETFPTVWDGTLKAESVLKSEDSNHRIIDKLKTMYQKTKAGGMSIDPLWNMTHDQIKSVYQYQAMGMADEQKYQWYQNNKDWYQPLADERQKFFGSLPNNDPYKPNKPIEFPQPTPEVAAMKKEFYNLEGADRFAYSRSHPAVQEQLDKEFKYKNDIIEARGGTGYKEYPKATPEVQSFIDQYMAADKTTRKGIRNSNPKMYQNMAAYFDSTSLYGIASESSKTRLKGQPDYTQSEAKKIKGLANDIYQNADGTYSIIPAGWMQGLSNGSGGGYGSGKKTDTSINPMKYAVSINAGGSPPTVTKSKVKLATLGKAKVGRKNNKPKVSIKKSKV